MKTTRLMDDVLVDVFSFSSEYNILLPVVIHSLSLTNSMEEDEVHCLVLSIIECMVNRIFSLSYVSISPNRM